MSDPNNVPLPQQPEANGTPTPNPVPQYGAPAPAQPSQPAQPAYGQPAYGQPAPTANSYGQAAPTYGQPAPDALLRMLLPRSLPALLEEVHGVQGPRVPQ